MYFFIDYAYAKGIPREKSRGLYGSPRYLHYFVKFTLFLCFRELIAILVKSAMIKQMGIKGFNAILVTNTVLNYIFTAVMIMYIMYIIKQIHKSKVAVEDIH